MSQSIAQTVVLKCDCGGDLFAPVVRLRGRMAGGTVAEPAGHMCAACHILVDNAYMLKLMERQEKIREVQRLTDELAATADPAGRPSTVKA